MTRALIIRALRAWSAWRWRRSLPKASAAAMECARQMRAARGNHKATRDLRREMALIIAGRKS